MKKIIIFSLILFFNCENEISDNIPSFQAKVNAFYPWNALDYSATISENSLILNGFNQNGEVYLLLNNLVTGENCYNSNSENYAYYQSKLSYVNERFRDTIRYSSLNNGTGIALLSEFCINIDQVDFSNNFLTGDFYFNAYNYSGEYSINISEGVFYKIPINSVD